MLRDNAHCQPNHGAAPDCLHSKLGSYVIIPKFNQDIVVYSMSHSFGKRILREPQVNLFNLALLMLKHRQSFL